MVIRSVLMKASSINAVVGEIKWPSRLRAKTDRNVAIAPAVNGRHSTIDNRAPFFRMIQISFLKDIKRNSLLLAPHSVNQLSKVNALLNHGS